MFDVRFKTPTTILLAGATKCGKTTFALNLLRNIDDLFLQPRCKQNIIYYYKKWQDSFAAFRKENIVTHWVNALPTEDDFTERTLQYKSDGGSVVVIDDFGQDLNKDIANIFKVLSHHNNTTVILMTQNIFGKNPVFREISLNCLYVVLFKNPRDTSQISHFVRQFDPQHRKEIVEAFRECTKPPHSYMLFDLEQSTNDAVRTRSHIFKSQWPMRNWTPKDWCVM
jgi:hypothetical protein